MFAPGERNRCFSIMLLAICRNVSRDALHHARRATAIRFIRQNPPTSHSPDGRRLIALEVLTRRLWLSSPVLKALQLISKQAVEASLVEALLIAIGAVATIEEHSDRPDIVLSQDGRWIGVEVTELHPDESN
jgi:hypothetical protein